MTATSATPNQQARNRAAYEIFHQACNSHDLAQISKAIDQVIDPEVLFHAPVPTGLSGPEAMKQVWSVLFEAFPDIQVTIEDVIAEGDKLVMRNTVTGTNRGEYRGMPPTGKTVRYNEIFIFRFDNDRVAEIWGVVDLFGQLKQLDAI